MTELNQGILEERHLQNNKELVEKLKQEGEGITHNVILLADVRESGYWTEEKERLKEGCKRKTETYTETHWEKERIVFRRGETVNVAELRGESIIWSEDKESGEIKDVVRGRGLLHSLWDFCYDEEELYRDAQEARDKASELTVLIWKMQEKYTGRYHDGTEEMFEIAHTLINKGVDIIRAFAISDAKKAPVEIFAYRIER